MTIADNSGGQGPDRAHYKKAWDLLTAGERRGAIIAVIVLVITSVVNAVGVASIYPFLIVLSDPGAVQENAWLAWGYDLVGASSTREFAVILSLLTLLMIFMTGAMQVVRIYVVERFSIMRIHSLSHRLLSIFTRQPILFFVGRNTGDMAKGILDETREVVRQFFRPVADLVGSTWNIASVLVVMLLMMPTFTLIAITFAAVSYGGIYLMVRKLLGSMGLLRLNANAARYRLSSETLSGIRDIKISGTEQYYLDKYRAVSFDFARTQVNANIISASPRYFVEVLAFAGIITAAFFLIEPGAAGQGAGGQASGGGIGAILPELGLLIFGAQRLLPEVQKLYSSFSKIRFGTAALDNVHRDIMLGRTTVSLPKTPATPIHLQKEVALRDVSFAYPGSDTSALDAIDLTIAKGEKIGIVGGTGAGKSTVADLLLGLLRPTGGDIAVDGTPLADEDIRGWQRAISYVPQQIFLSDATVAENIAIGQSLEEVDMAKLEEAARIAQLHEFVTTQLPGGYHEQIGERGVRLSGGQRQRIGIARALYRDADVIVFDEATSALDNVTERELVASIEALPGDKTLIMIAHRLTTVRACDRIIVMKNGAIVASGNWDENIESSEEFRDLAQVR